jgi:hypothetical protein
MPFPEIRRPPGGCGKGAWKSGGNERHPQTPIKLTVARVARHTKELRQIDRQRQIQRATPEVRGFVREAQAESGKTGRGIDPRPVPYFFTDLGR